MSDYTPPIIRIPTWVDRNLLSEEVKSIERLPKSLDKALWIVHRLTCLTHSIKDARWFGLSSKQMERVVGRKYREYLNLLIRLDIVKAECEGRKGYQVGRACKRYALAHPLNKVERMSVSSPAVGILVKADQKTRQDNWRLHANSTNVDRWLAICLKELGFRADQTTMSANDKANLADLEDEVIRYTIDGTSNRRHTPFVVLSSETRKTLYFKSDPKEEVIEVDLPNSQPIFAYIAHIQSVSRNSGLVSGVKNRSNDDLNQDMETAEHIEREPKTCLEAIQEASQAALPPALPSGSSTMFCSLDSDIDHQDSDIDQYLDDVSNGRLYERIMEVTGMTDRKRVKRKLFTYVFYGKQFTTWKNTPLAKAFAGLYPTIWQWIVQDKETYGHRHLAVQMQTMESQFVFERVLPRFIEAHPTARAVACHDAIYVAKRYEREMRSIMQDEFGKLGVEVYW